MTRNEAHEVYTRNLADVRALLADITSTVSMHEECEADDPDNWGYAGDLAHIRERLTEVVRFLGGES